MNRRQRRRLRFFGIFLCVVLLAVLGFLRWHGHPPAARASAEHVLVMPVKQIAKTPAETKPVAESNPSGAALVTDAQAKIKAGDLLAARRVLNDALVAGSVDEAQILQAKSLISTANQTIVFSPRHFPEDPYETLITVAPGQTLAKIAQTYNITWNFLANINNLSNPKLLRAKQTLKVIKGPFNAVVTKSTFTMDIWLGPPEQKGSMFVTTYRVGLGLDNSTPTGTWIVEPNRKLRNPTYFSPRGQGIIQADDPKNPLGKYWIGITGVNGQAVGKMSYGIHGTIDPSSIGKMSSLGCIRLGDADIAQVFTLLVEGKSTVIVRK